MEKHRIILWLIVFGFFTWLIVLMPSPNAGVGQNLNITRQNMLRTAMTEVRQSIECGYSEIGYAYYEPEVAADRFVKYMEVSITPLREEEELNTDTVSVGYTVGKPQKSWQVALFPDDESNEIRVYGYGNDTINPLFSEVVHCGEAEVAKE